MLPAKADSVSNPPTYFVLAFLLSPVALEFIFRGLIHGMLAQTASIQNCDSRWFLSWPNLMTAILYGSFIAFKALDLNQIPHHLTIDWTMFGSLVAGLAFGLAAGLARERSQSLLPACLFHATAAVAIFFLSIAMH